MSALLCADEKHYRRKVNACFSPTLFVLCAQQKVSSIGYEAKKGHTTVQAKQAGPQIRKGLGDDMLFELTRLQRSSQTYLSREQATLHQKQLDG